MSSATYGDWPHNMFAWAYTNAPSTWLRLQSRRCHLRLSCLQEGPPEGRIEGFYTTLFARTKV